MRKKGGKVQILTPLQSGWNEEKIVILPLYPYSVYNIHRAEIQNF